METAAVPDVMRPLDACRGNYLYDDWDEVVSSAALARELLATAPGGGELGRARQRWASLLAQGALFKRARWINWRVPPDATVLPPHLFEEIRELGALVDSLLTGVDRSLASNPLLREILGFPACPEEAALWEIHRGIPLPFFRLDLAIDLDLHPKLLEIQIVMGGLGLFQAIRSAYGPHPELPGNAALYETAVMESLISWWGARAEVAPRRPVTAILGARESVYRHEHLALARYMKDLELVVAPTDLLGSSPSGRPALPDGREVQVIHRLFRSPFMFQRSPTRARLMLDFLRKGHIHVVNPWKDVLEDKRLLTLVHDEGAAQALPGCLSRHAWTRFRQFVPGTWLAGPERIEGLVGQPRSRRGFYLKKGRSFSSRDLTDGQQVTRRAWDAACARALEERDWIIQEAIRGAPWPFRYLDFENKEIRTMNGFVRLSPFFFRESNGNLRLGDVAITARPHRSRVHGASDAVLVVPGVKNRE